MSEWMIYSIGLGAQLLFSVRMLVQWIGSERAGKVVSPVLFWCFSLLGAALLLVYGLLRRDLVIVIGQSILYSIYVRNLMLISTNSIHARNEILRNSLSKLSRFLIWILFPLPIVAILWSPIGVDLVMETFSTESDISLWLFAIGGTGQGLFIMRFVYQWIRSEKAGNSVLPLGFWALSVMGTVLLLVYAVFRRDPAILLGQMFGLVVYARNIRLCFLTPRENPHLA